MAYGKKCGSCGSGSSKKMNTKSKKIKTKDYSVTQKKMTLICNSAGTTNPDELQRY